MTFIVVCILAVWFYGLLIVRKARASERTDGSWISGPPYGPRHRYRLVDGVAVRVD